MIYLASIGIQPTKRCIKRVRQNFGCRKYDKLQKMFMDEPCTNFEQH